MAHADHRPLTKLAKIFATLATRGGPNPTRTPRNSPRGEGRGGGPNTDNYGSPTPTNPHAKPPTLPTSFAWLLRLITATPSTASPAALARSALQELLADPAMIALIQSDPAFGRVLRPLSHLLGLKPPQILRLPRRPRAKPPAPASPRRPIARPPSQPHPIFPPPAAPPFYLPAGTNVLACAFPQIFRA